MVVSLLSLKKSEKKWLEEIALDKKCSPSFIEKDYYFCQLLKILSRLKSDDFSLVFTGGTALSKAYNLIDRFSEDCDMLLIGKNLTRSTLSKIRDHIANHINAESNDVLKIYEKNAKNNNQNMTFSIAYPKFFDTPVAVRPELKLEVIAKEETLLDTKNERIISFLRFAQKKIDDHTTFKCLAIEEILAGKISALIWKYQKKESQGNNIRHLYDTASIYAQKQIDLSVLKKIIFYIAKKDLEKRAKNKDLPLVDACKICINNFKEEPIFEEEYKKFVEGLIYSSEDSSSLTYQEAVRNVETLMKNLFFGENA